MRVIIVIIPLIYNMFTKYINYMGHIAAVCPIPVILWIVDIFKYITQI